MGTEPTVVLARWLAAFACAVGVASVPCILGCDATTARPAQTPTAGQNVVAREAVGGQGTAVCAIDDEEPEQWLPEDPTPSVRPVEYVKMSEWTPPPSVQALEAVVPPRGDVPPSYIQFPQLTKHSSLGGGVRVRRH